ncbi:MAG: metal-dependent transcriptional regulator [Lachnospiraceae bacterium]|nr:metal-dependent transcriptional regulator [Lachnospiraceae bacterium]
MKQKKSVEDYLKVIYILSKQKEVHGADIAGELKVSRPTVSIALKALAEEGYIFVDDAYEVHLTVKGRRIAEDIYERHDTFRHLLMSLGVDEKTAAADACEMEHAVSQASYEALKVLTEKAKGESVR